MQKLYTNSICRSRYYSATKQNNITSTASLQFHIEQAVEEIKQTMKRHEIITIEHITCNFLENICVDFGLFILYNFSMIKQYTLFINFD